MASNKIKSNAREGQVDIRDDEDKEIKLTEIVELLVAAGYFRARIKGLSPFDKIVGGLTWSIETCNFDVDIDLLFNENLTIGHKIALTERIVQVLKSMKCPYRLEPHQIQGLDTVHIFPVIQWLVIRALKTREEFGDETRNYSVEQFSHYYTIPTEETYKTNVVRATKSLATIQAIYGPKRKWRKKENVSFPTKSLQIQSTLLEYGQFFLPQSENSLKSVDESSETDKQQNNESHVEVEKIMKDMTAAETFQGKLTAQSVKNIVSQTAFEIAATSRHFSKLKREVADEILGDKNVSQSRMLIVLKKEEETLLTRLHLLQEEERTQLEKHKSMKASLLQVKQFKSDLQAEKQNLSAIDLKENKSILEELSQLVEDNERVKKEEVEFKDTCKKESEKTKQEISDLQEHLDLINDDVSETFNEEKEKFNKARQKMAKKIRMVETLKRYIDDVPGRAELSQYQRRFVELYNQIAATHRETQQFYNMYNTLADSKIYMAKELTLLNSIHDNMFTAFGNASSMDEYLQQLDNIVEGLHQNKSKLEQRQVEEVTLRNSLAEELNALQDMTRQYAKAIHMLGQELAKNKALNERLSVK